MHFSWATDHRAAAKLATRRGAGNILRAGPAGGSAAPPRRRLGRAPLERFTTRGYHDTPPPPPAKKAGTAEGPIYRHFDSKEHLLNELYRGAARWATKLVQDAARAPGSPPERLPAAARARGDGAARHPGAAPIPLLTHPSPPPAHR